MVKPDISTGKLFSTKTGMVFADRGYYYGLVGRAGKGQRFDSTILAEKKCRLKKGTITISGYLLNGHIRLYQVFQQKDDHLEETIMLKNIGAEAVEIDNLKLGFVADLTIRPKWRLCAIPFRIQLDGSMHDYSTEALINSKFGNAVYTDKTRPEPSLVDG